MALPQVEVLWVLSGFCPWVTDVTLNVEPFSYLHGVMRTHPEPRTGNPHQFYRVESNGTTFGFLLARHSNTPKNKLIIMILRRLP